MIKAIFLDLDGTLLTTDKRITANSENALNECKLNGIKIYVATARPPLLSESLNITKEKLNSLFDGGVYYDGSCVVLNSKKEYLALDSELAIRVITFITEEEDANIAIQMTNEIHSFKNDLDDNVYKYWGIKKSECFPYDIIHNSNEDFVKIITFSNSSLEKLYKSIIRNFQNEIKIYPSNNYKMLQIIHKKSNKKFGIDQILKKENINKKNVAVFGDDLNDVEMLSSFDYSIAMGNSIEDVKKVSKYITLTNDQDGISYALKSLLFLI
jgi:hypothetical protein